jgi:bifunctional non-homologous end joining protein LigD
VPAAIRRLEDGLDEAPAPKAAAKPKAPTRRKKPVPLAEVALTDAMGIAAAKALGVNLTHPDRVIYPSDGVTKAQIVAYYGMVAERMLPHVANRPLSLVRTPQGQGKQTFFQKHDSGGFPASFKKIPILEKDGSTEEYLFIDGPDGLAAGVQMSTLEFHIWGSHIDDVDKPDRIIFDIDPDEGLDFNYTREAAKSFRDRLADMGLKTYPMVTGGKGIHVIAPLQPTLGWTEVKAFCRGFAELVAEEEPDRFTANIRKNTRKGRMFVDYLRNERGSTAVAPFSTRARVGAPCAVPVTWDEIETLEHANSFSLPQAAAKAQEPDPWPDYFKLKQAITAKMLKIVKAEV